MANKQRGYYSIKLGGKMRKLHFSMNFWANFTDTLGISLDKIGDIFGEGISLGTIRSLIYSAILANDQEEGNEIDYNEFIAWAFDNVLLQRHQVISSVFHICLCTFQIVSERP